MFNHIYDSLASMGHNELTVTTFVAVYVVMRTIHATLMLMSLNFQIFAVLFSCNAIVCGYKEINREVCFEV